jgi:thioredoxin 1
MSDVVYVDDSSFETEVLKSEVPVLVDFSATWCGPCQRQMPILEKFATTNSNKIKVAKVDIDEAPQITAKLGIKSVPSIILFNHGQRVDMKVGLTTLADLDHFVLAKVGA